GSLVTDLQALEYVVGINTFRRAFDLFGAVTVVPGSLGAFRRDVLEAVQGYSADTVTEDFDLTIAILKAGFSIHASEGTVYTEAP
ncbi:glycosyltransferase family 2 protein, partial [Halorubrum sp. SP3]